MLGSTEVDIGDHRLTGRVVGVAIRAKQSAVRHLGVIDRHRIMGAEREGVGRSGRETGKSQRNTKDRKRSFKRHSSYLLLGSTRC